MLSGSGADWGQEREDSSNEDGPSTAKPVVEWIRDPASEQSDGDVRNGVDEAYDPTILLAGTRRLALVASIRDAEAFLESEIGAIRAGLIPIRFCCQLTDAQVACNVVGI